MLRFCETCDKEFTPKKVKANSRFCSGKCRSAWHNQKRKVLVEKALSHQQIILDSINEEDIPIVEWNKHVSTMLHKISEHLVAGASSSSCTSWSGGKKDGYPTIKYFTLDMPASRVLWRLCHGRIPAGWMVMHKCDNRECLNILHLMLGTAKDNYDDAVTKGRIVQDVNGRFLPLLGDEN